jgi:ATP-dependent Lon protease
MKPWEATELNFDASTFSGLVRLFPLPNLVLYPHVMQPLHIFEERYREMLEDALAGDQLITMAVLEPGWETDYDSRPPISEFACLGKVVAHHRLADGRYNVLLLGVQRVQIVRELDPLRSFRRARVELLEDCYDFESTHERKRMQEQLQSAFRRHLPCACELPEQLESMLSNQLPLGLLTDLAAYALPLAPEVKLDLLAECRVRRRAETLLREVKKLKTAKAAKSPAPPLVFPPVFSDN